LKGKGDFDTEQGVKTGGRLEAEGGEEKNFYFFSKNVFLVDGPFRHEKAN